MNAIIDGYNLLFAIGLASPNASAKEFERSRVRLLDWLADGLKGRDFALRVVFDGQGNPIPSPETGYRGIRVRFSHGQTADELIEELIHAVPRPPLVTVVSNDRQVQDAARTCGCTVSTCQEFVDAMIAEPAKDADEKPVEKKDEPASEAEMAAWLEAFSKPKPRPPGRK